MSYNTNEIINLFRKELSVKGLDGFLIPRADKYQGEEVRECDERLAFISGFTGSAGIAVISCDRAMLFSDGRYKIQMEKQTDNSVFQCFDLSDEVLINRIKECFSAGAKIGYDPLLHVCGQIEKLQKALEGQQIKLISCVDNPVDNIWINRPQQSFSPIFDWDYKYCGMQREKKATKIIETMKDDDIGAFILISPHAVSWLLNVRSHELKNTPCVLSFAIIYASNSSIEWLVNSSRLDADLTKKIASCSGVKIYEESELADRITELSNMSKKNNFRIGLDFSKSPIWFYNELQKHGVEPIDYHDPCIRHMAIKRDTEIQSMKNAHKRDAIAVCEFIKELKESLENKEELDEITISERLSKIRQKQDLYFSESFETICGFAENGAIIHYHADNFSNKKITYGSQPNLLLIDSGAQYLDGTTDITRTFAVGNPTDEMKEHYTLVLKAHIAVAKAIFPAGTSGVQIDALARSVLWARGLDYAHGTGHGVGCFLSVHEESATLSPRNSAYGLKILEEGMILSNEPGLYFEGKYGIRLENLVVVINTGQKDNYGRDLLGFETITLVPFEESLINYDMLDFPEIEWLKEYNKFCEQLIKTAQES